MRMRELEVGEKIQNYLIENPTATRRITPCDPRKLDACFLFRASHAIAYFIRYKLILAGRVNADSQPTGPVPSCTIKFVQDEYEIEFQVPRWSLLHKKTGQHPKYGERTLAIATFEGMNRYFRRIFAVARRRRPEIGRTLHYIPHETAWWYTRCILSAIEIPETLPGLKVQKTGNEYIISLSA
ncbi:MAG TPA: hypothetical protein VFQ60_05485 [Patescibacteria group bacterium]|nr:hypothetical protein [Patescibacteria group bacterium]